MKKGDYQKGGSSSSTAPGAAPLAKDGQRSVSLVIPENSAWASSADHGNTDHGNGERQSEVPGCRNLSSEINKISHTVFPYSGTGGTPVDAQDEVSKQDSVEKQGDTGEMTIINIGTRGLADITDRHGPAAVSHGTNSDFKSTRFVPLKDPHRLRAPDEELYTPTGGQSPKSAMSLKGGRPNNQANLSLELNDQALYDLPAMTYMTGPGVLSPCIRSPMSMSPTHHGTHQGRGKSQSFDDTRRSQQSQQSGWSQHSQGRPIKALNAGWKRPVAHGAAHHAPYSTHGPLSKNIRATMPTTSFEKQSAGAIDFLESKKEGEREGNWWSVILKGLWQKWTKRLWIVFTNLIRLKTWILMKQFFFDVIGNLHEDEKVLLESTDMCVLLRNHWEQEEFYLDFYAPPSYTPITMGNQLIHQLTNMPWRLCLAIDIGGTRTKFKLVDGNTNEICKIAKVNSQEIWETYDPAISLRQYISKTLSNNLLDKIDRLIFSVPGTIDIQQAVGGEEMTVVKNMPSFSSKFRGFDFKKNFRPYFGNSKVSAVCDNLAAAIGCAVKYPNVTNGLVVVLGTAPAISTFNRKGADCLETGIWQVWSWFTKIELNDKYGYAGGVKLVDGKWKLNPSDFCKMPHKQARIRFALDNNTWLRLQGKHQGLPQKYQGNLTEAEATEVWISRLNSGLKALARKFHKFYGPPDAIFVLGGNSLQVHGKIDEISYMDPEAVETDDVSMPNTLTTPQKISGDLTKEQQRDEQKMEEKETKHDSSVGGASTAIGNANNTSATTAVTSPIAPGTAENLTVSPKASPPLNGQMLSTGNRANSNKGDGSTRADGSSKSDRSATATGTENPARLTELLQRTVPVITCSTDTEQQDMTMIGLLQSSRFKVKQVYSSGSDPLERGWTRGGEIYHWIPRKIKSSSPDGLTKQDGSSSQLSCSNNMRPGGGSSSSVATSL